MKFEFDLFMYKEQQMVENTEHGINLHVIGHCSWSAKVQSFPQGQNAYDPYLFVAFGGLLVCHYHSGWLQPETN